MIDMDISLIKRTLFDRIEDGSSLSQASRIWLLNIIEGTTVTFLIRNFVMTYTHCEKLDDVKELLLDDVVDHVFYNFIEK